MSRRLSFCRSVVLSLLAGCAADIRGFAREAVAQANAGAEAASQSADAATPRRVVPLSVEHLLSMRRFATGVPIALSPDRKWVAYTLINPRRIDVVPSRLEPRFLRNGVSGYARGTELWVTNIASGRSKNLSSKTGVTWGPVWSPDGRWLAFYSDRDGLPRLWLWDPASNLVRRLSAAVVRPWLPGEVVRWAPDGKALVVKLASGGLDTEVARGTASQDEHHSPGTKPGGIRVYRSLPDGKGPVLQAQRAQQSWFVGDLSVIAIATGKVRPLVRETPIASYLVSPTGTHVAYTVLHGYEALNSPDNRLDIALVDLSTGASRLIAKNVPHSITGLGLSWSPDGRTVAYVTNSLSRTVQEDCYVVSIAGGPPRNITPGTHPPFGTDYFRAPLWGPDGKTVYLLGNDTIWRASTSRSRPGVTAVASVPARALRSIIGSSLGDRIWSPDSGRSLYVRTYDRRTAQTGTAHVRIQTGQVSLMFEEDAAGHVGEAAQVGVDVAGPMIVTIDQRAHSPEDIWVTDSSFEHRRQLTHVNPFLDGYVFGRSRTVSWLSLDGVPLQGALLLPVGYTAGRRYPLLVYAYGPIPVSQQANQFGLVPHNYNMQLLATRGFAVFAPDAPLHVGTPMLDLAKTILPGINKVIELGIADPERLAVMGYSYGGYSAMALIVQTPRFRAAVSIAGAAANLFTMYSHLDEQGYGHGTGILEGYASGRMGASPWERRDRYLDNSPYFHLDRVETPLLLIYGTADDAVPAAAPAEIFVGLRRLGKRVVFVKYDGADHTLSQSVLNQQRDYYTRILKWLTYYVGDKSSGHPLESR